MLHDYNRFHFVGHVIYFWILCKNIANLWHWITQTITYIWYNNVLAENQLTWMFVDCPIKPLLRCKCSRMPFNPCFGLLNHFLEFALMLIACCCERWWECLGIFTEKGSTFRIGIIPWCDASFDQILLPLVFGRFSIWLRSCFYGIWSWLCWVGSCFCWVLFSV